MTGDCTFSVFRGDRSDSEILKCGDEVSSVPFVPSVVSRFTTEDTEGTKKTCKAKRIP